MAQSLRLIINQRLARSADGKRTPLREFLVFDADLRSQFLRTDPGEWPALTSRAVEEKGQSYRAAIASAARAGRITEATAASSSARSVERHSVKDALIRSFGDDDNPQPGEENAAVIAEFAMPEPCYVA